MNSPHIMVLGSSKGKEPNPDPAILNRKALQEEIKKKKKRRQATINNFGKSELWREVLVTFRPLGNPFGFSCLTASAEDTLLHIFTGMCMHSYKIHIMKVF